MRYTLFLSLVVCGFGLSLNGCSGSESGAYPSGASNTIRRGNTDDPETLDPLLAEDVHTFNILIDLYEGLVAADAYGKLVPGVAESWSVSADGLSYTFTLRSNARWSNGDPVTAGDFVRGFRRAAAPAALSAYASLLTPIANFSAVKSGTMPREDLGVVAVDEQTVVIELHEPCTYLLSLLAMPVAFPVYGDGANPSQFVDPAKFVGNGAYVLVQHRIGSPVKLRRNELYWDKEAVKTEFIEYVAIVNETTEFNMYRAGELDITGSIPSSRVRQAKESFKNEVRIAPSLALYYLAFDLTESPLDDRDLRQALSMAIDREQLVTILGRGERPAYSVVPPGVADYKGERYQWGDSENATMQVQARELYKKAGYGPGNQLTLKYTYDVGSIHETVALAVGAMWEDTLGVVVEFDKREWKYFLDTRDNRDEWQVMRFGWFGDYNDASTFLNIFVSEDVQNLPRYSSATYDGLFRSASTEVDAVLRAELMAKAEDVLIKDYPIAPLYFYVSKHMVKPDVIGFENNVLDRHPSKYLYRRD